MLEASLALSVANSIVQFAEFSLKVADTTYKLYKDGESHNEKEEELRNVATQLSALCNEIEKLNDESEETGSKNPESDLSREARKACMVQVKDLAKVTKTFHGSAKHNACRSLGQAIQSTWRQPKVKKDLSKLQQLQNMLTLNNTIEVRRDIQDVRASVSNCCADLGQFESNFEKLISELTRAIKNLQSPKAQCSSVQMHGVLLQEKRHDDLDGCTTLVDSSSYTDGRQIFVSESAIRKRILNALFFGGMNKRYGNVSRAEAHTFRWIYELDRPKQAGWDNFAAWLRYGSDRDQEHQLYWISGRMGSGKSTLMKFLVEDPQTKRYLEQWADGSELLLAHCFFWADGEQIQKSQEDLLRSLLFQLLLEYSFPATVFPHRWRLLENGLECDPSWSDDELCDAIMHFFESAGAGYKFCLFIDGLDEFEGDPEQQNKIYDILLRLSSNSAIKVCVSSRPDILYMEMFEGLSQLKLHDLTRQDIELFVHNRLENNKTFKKWSSGHPHRSEYLKTAITEKARGVFLWVKLVTSSLLAGLLDGADAGELLQILEETPAELEAVVRKILKKIDEKPHKDYVWNVFRFCLFTHIYDRSVVDYAFACSNELDTGTPVGNNYLTRNQVLKIQSEEKRRINARCKGLLETVSPRSEYRPHDNWELLRFPHASVSNIIKSHFSRDKAFSEVNLQMFRSDLSQLKSCNPVNPWMSLKRCRGRMVCAMRCLLSNVSLSGEQLSKHSVKHVACDLPAVFDHLLTFSVDQVSEPFSNETLSAAECWSPTTFYDWQAKEIKNGSDVISYMIESGFERLALELMSDWTAERALLKPGRPYLDYVVSLEDQYCCFQGQEEWQSRYAVVRLLLHLGADPNQVWDGQTVWTRCLLHMLLCRDHVRGSFPGGLQSRDTSSRSGCFEICKMLIQHGAARSIRSTYASYTDTNRSKHVVVRDLPRHAVRQLFRGKRRELLLGLLADGCPDVPDIEQTITEDEDNKEWSEPETDEEIEERTTSEPIMKQVDVY